jgi:hypothetical protein
LAEQSQFFFRTRTHRQQGKPSDHADTSSSNERENEGTAIKLQNNEPVSNIEGCADSGDILKLLTRLDPCTEGVKLVLGFDIQWDAIITEQKRNPHPIVDEPEK